MNIALWVVAGILAAAFLAAGLMKVAQPRPKLVASGMTYAEDFSDGAMKGIGAVEVLGALGLILPAVLDTATVLVPLAATGLFLVMVGAAVVHIRRKETFVPALVLGLLALVVAVFRFGTYAF
ncbi:DoxX family protein [Georgenia sp. SYP-B2076]|uniref:DoxX family protein n=1 Tax=Georgenia sp. SYP-B2076 TaxID=2495881 RepID=UPI000F8EF1E5|nr:DoxX family protein [Georgenia sp. SYP-B2076]